MGAYKYTVFVDDNFHYMDESERYKLGEFDDCASAIAACQRVVDESLAASSGGPDDALATYVMFGDDPFIVTDDPDCKFSARDYARQRFEAGVSDNLEVVQAQESLVVARQDYINSVFAHNLAKLSLARALGRAADNLTQFLLLK